jgi:hypothetical protein
MAKKRTAPKPDAERIELQVSAGFTAEVDRVAAAVGLSRSAYIRQACLERMVQDRRRLGLDEDRGGER